jgi:hypothetical protein
MITPRRPTFVRIALLSLTLTALPPAAVHAQRALPRSRADLLLESGLWPQAEEAYYAQSSARPRDPVARAELGRYLAMRGAVVPGTILIEEALQFGLDSTLARRLLRPWRTVIGWREMATLQADSVIPARAPADSLSLFAIRIPGNVMNPLRRDPSARTPYWVDVVPRQIGVDSMMEKNPRMGVEVLEGFVPSYDVANHRITLHADPRSATRGEGERYRVLRDTREVRVLMTAGRTLSLPAALEELSPSWWQLDLLHGWLVVKRQ